jgi:hypothetical protein
MAVRSVASLGFCAALLGSCGPKALVLPDDPIERAATCGAVAAASERSKTDFDSPLSLEAIGRVIHYPMLAASTGDSYSADTAAKVQERMTELQDAVVESKWQDLIPACSAEFPATAVETVTLPESRFEAQLGCDELADFLRSSLEARDEYLNELGEYRRLSNKLEPALAAGIRSHVGSQTAAQQAERRKMLATMAKAGPPVAVMRQCLTRFG